MKKLSLLIVLLIFVYLGWNIYEYRSQLIDVKLQFGFDDLILLLVVSLPIYFFNLVAWHTLTKTLNFNISFSNNAQIWMYSNVARLLPGGIWQYPGRLYLLSKQGVSKTSTLIALTLEFIFSLGVGAALSLMVVTNHQLVLSILLLILLLPLLISNHQILIMLTNLIRKIPQTKNVDLTTLQIKPHQLTLLSLVYLLTFIFPGLTLLSLTNLVASFDLTAIPMFVGLFAFSWIVGYLAIFAPGGLGVTEAVLTTLLSNYLPLGLAATIAVAFRVVLLFSELVMLAIVSIVTNSSFWRSPKN